jgi:chaperonin GroEL (HSP60 family)
MHDAIMVVKRSLKAQAVVAGGGAVEMEVSKLLREKSMEIEGKGQLVMQAFAKALEIVPRQLSDNAGFDATDVLNALRKKVRPRALPRPPITSPSNSSFCSLAYSTSTTPTASGSALTSTRAASATRS